MPEILVPHSEIEDPQRITEEMIKRFKEKGLDIHHNDVMEVEDCYKTGRRIIKVKGNKKYVFISK